MLSSIAGNSAEAETHQKFEFESMTTSVTENIKRSYYKAVFIPKHVTDESFTGEFKAAVRALVDRPYSYVGTFRFISRWGNCSKYSSSRA